MKYVIDSGCQATVAVIVVMQLIPKVTHRDVERIAKRDFSPYAEYPGCLDLVSPLGGLSLAKTQEIVDADWQSYSEWLARGA